jgi:hypothetical protein
MNSPNYPCKCGHEEQDHKFRDRSADKILEDAVKWDVLIPDYDPDRMLPKGYSVLTTFGNKYYTWEEMQQSLEKSRETVSGCRGCKCKNFQADNFKYLERLSESK